MSMHTWLDPGKSIVIRRVDVKRVHDYARENCSLRDYLLIRLPMKIGLRTGEIATLKIENINFHNRSFQVLDSKKKELFPLPLDMITLQLIQDLIKDRKEGYVFRHEETWQHKLAGKQLSTVHIWQRTKNIGSAAGVEGFKPRILRHYFAANWVTVEKKTVEGLRRILRHKNLTMTQTYLSRLVFFEDIQNEYDNLQNDPVIQKATKPMLNSIYQELCAKCAHEPICKLREQVCNCEWATGCKHYTTKVTTPVRA